MHRPHPIRWIKAGAALAMVSLTQVSSAAGFGIFDPRTLSLGGTSVAMGDLATGHLYNPALTALHTGHEDRTSDGYHSYLATLSSVSAGARIAGDAIGDNLEQRLYDAIDQFNAEPNEASAAFGEAAATSLRKAMQDLAEGDILLDGYLGYTVSEPGDGEGGAFFVGARAMGGGVAEVGRGDVELVGDYIEALRFFRSAGVEGEPHLELFEADGSLRSPRNQITSSAEARAMLLIEVGVSAAKTWQLWNMPWTFGAAPKVVVAGTFHERWQVVEDDFESVGADSRHLYLNMDVGTSVQLHQNWRAALAIKDILPRTMRSTLGYDFQIKPLPRMGVAYHNSHVQLGLDLDLAAIEAIHNGFPRQDLSAGAEFTPWPALQLRLGYRHDIAGDFGAVVTAGIGLKIGFASVDVAYAEGDGDKGAALRLGVRH